MFLPRALMLHGSGSTYKRESKQDGRMAETFATAWLTALEQRILWSELHALSFKN